MDIFFGPSFYHPKSSSAHAPHKYMQYVLYTVHMRVKEKVREREGVSLVQMFPAVFSLQVCYQKTLAEPRASVFSFTTAI